MLKAIPCLEYQTGYGFFIIIYYGYRTVDMHNKL